MGLKFNGKIPININFNNNIVKKVKYNSTTVWESMASKGYTPVNYISNENSLAYINTGYYPNLTTRLEIKFTYLYGNWLFGSRTSSTASDQFVYYTSTNGGTFRVDGTPGDNVSGLGTDEVYDGTFTCTNMKIFADGDSKIYKKVSGASNFTGAYPMFLLAQNMAGSVSGNIFHGKVYGCKIYASDTLVRHFIPCYRNSDEKAGLYDIVNDVFYAPQGSGSFTYG